jgi:hypothetical protein
MENGVSSPTLVTLRNVATALKVEIDVRDLIPASIEKDIWYLRSLGVHAIDREIMRRKWYVHLNDLIGGYCAMPVDTPPSSGCFSIADFNSVELADHIVELHNSTIAGAGCDPTVSRGTNLV